MDCRNKGNVAGARSVPHSFEGAEEKGRVTAKVLFRRPTETPSASALRRLKAKQGLALFLQIQPVPRDEAQVFRIGAEQALLTLMPLQNGFTLCQLGLQILNLSLHFVAPSGLGQIPNGEGGYNEHDNSSRHGTV